MIVDLLPEHHCACTHTSQACFCVEVNPLIRQAFSSLNEPSGCFVENGGLWCVLTGGHCGQTSSHTLDTGRVWPPSGIAGVVTARLTGKTYEWKEKMCFIVRHSCKSLEARRRGRKRSCWFQSSSVCPTGCCCRAFINGVVMGSIVLFVNVDSCYVCLSGLICGHFQAGYVPAFTSLIRHQTSSRNNLNSSVVETPAPTSLPFHCFFPA